MARPGVCLVWFIDDLPKWANGSTERPSLMQASSSVAAAYLYLAGECSRGQQRVMVMQEQEETRDQPGWAEEQTMSPEGVCGKGGKMARLDAERWRGRQEGG